MASTPAGGAAPGSAPAWPRFIGLGIFIGFVASLLPLLLIGGGSPGSPGQGISQDSTVAPVSRIDTPTDLDTGSVEDKPTFEAPPAFTLDPDVAYVADLELESGTVRIELFNDLAPVHVNNFVFLAEQGFYDGLTFHRVVPGFVAQAGDPTATSSGGAGYVLPDEAADDAATLSLGDAGIIAMARSGAGASSSQFFITQSPQATLDALGFTAFGRVVEGLDLIIELPERDPQARPAPPAGARIVSITIRRLSPRSDTGSAAESADDAESDSAEPAPSG